MNKSILVFFLFFVYFLGMNVTSFAQEVTNTTPPFKIAEKKGGRYVIVAEERSLVRLFTKLFSNDSVKVYPENFNVKAGVANLEGGYLLYAESYAQGGSCLMRVYLTQDIKGDLVIENTVLGESCVNVECGRCAFDEQGGCFCSLRENNERVVGCSHVLLMAERGRKQ